MTYAGVALGFNTSAGAPPAAYEFVGFYTSSTSITVPAGKTKLAVFMTGSAGNGFAGENPSTAGPGGYGGGGGGSGAFFCFKDYTIAAGGVIEIDYTNYPAGSLGYQTSAIVQLAPGNDASGQTGAPGGFVAYSGVTSGEVVSFGNGIAGGNGGNGGNDDVGQPGDSVGSAGSMTMTLTGLGTVNATYNPYGGGGGGGGASSSSSNFTGGSGGSSSGGGSGGNGADAEGNVFPFDGSAGSTANNYGNGGGGGGGGGADLNTPQASLGGVGGSGTGGVIELYWA
jgi:hypothetical protein